MRLEPVGIDTVGHERVAVGSADVNRMDLVRRTSWHVQYRLPLGLCGGCTPQRLPARPGDHVTMDPIEVVDHHGDTIVRSRYDGTYDKTKIFLTSW